MRMSPSALLVALAVGVASALAPADAHAAGFGPSCPVTVDDSGGRTWRGTPTYPLESEANRLAAVVDSHPDSLTMAAICSDLSGIILYGAIENPLMVAGVREFMSSHKYPISYVVVPTSRSDLDAKTQVVQALLSNSGKSFLAGSDYVKGVVSIQPLIVEGSPASEMTAEEVLRAGAKAAVQTEFDPNPEYFDYSATRYNDSAPFKAGAAIFAAGQRCSLGPRVSLGGRYMILTAGHCPGGTHTTNGGISVGSLYTTTAGGTTGRYGDWKLLYTKSYSSSYYAGGAYSTDASVRPGVAANWGTLAIGAGACHSGSTTGEICRYHVNEVNRYPTVEGVLLAHMTRLIHDNMNTSNPRDCDGWQGGDSGGPIYHAYDSSYSSVRYDGLVMGVTWIWVGSQKRCSYWFTQLSGVRAWNSGVTF